MNKSIRFLFLIFIALLYLSASEKVFGTFTQQYNLTYHLTKGVSMFKNKDPSNSYFLFGNTDSKFRSLEPDEEWLQLEKELKSRNLHYDPDIKWLMEIASSNNGQNSRWARNKIRILLESDHIIDMRTGDV